MLNSQKRVPEEAAIQSLNPRNIGQANRLSARMSLIVGLFQPFRREMRINLGRNEMSMAQELLNASKVRPGIEQVSGITVTNFMRGQMRVEPSDSQVFFQPKLQHPVRKRGAFFGAGEEDGRRPFGRLRQTI